MPKKTGWAKRVSIVDISTNILSNNSITEVTFQIRDTGWTKISGSKTSKDCLLEHYMENRTALSLIKVRGHARNQKVLSEGVQL